MNYLIYIVAAIFGGSASFAHASDDMSVKGFLTLGATASDQEKFYDKYTNHSVNFYNESRFGINFSRTLSEQYSVSAQIVSNGGDDTGHILPDFAFASYYANSNWTIRAGIHPFPIWLISDRKDIGKLYPWVTPPEEVYTLQPLRNYSGVNTSYRYETGNWQIEPEIFGGGAFGDTGRRDARAHVILSNLIGSSLTISNEYLKLRSAFVRGNASVETELFTIERIDTHFINFGSQIEYKNFLVLAEYARIGNTIDEGERKRARQAASQALADALAGNGNLDTVGTIAKGTTVDTSYATGNAAYITVGYQMDDFLGHVTYASLDTPRDPLTINSQNSAALGLKYDLSLFTDIKFEVKKINLGENSWGLYHYDLQNDDVTKFEDLTVVKAAMDFIF